MTITKNASSFMKFKVFLNEKLLFEILKNHIEQNSGEEMEFFRVD
jgi:hypothetical protein